MQGDLTPANIPDYGNDLAFAPRVTYRDVRKYAKELAKKKGLSFYFRAGGLGLIIFGYIPQVVYALD